MDSSSTTESTVDITPLDPHGVPLHVCLSGFGRHFSSSSAAVEKSTVAKVRPVSSYDHFLSHDWGTPRWLKVLSLIIIFNSPAAFWTTFVVTIMVGLAQAIADWPMHALVIIPYLSFIFVLCFWQTIRAWFLNPKIVFLDILCIPQHDEKLKQRGIAGLGNNLECSKELTVLWSPRYFSRLWCAYEIATFLRRSDGSQRIKVVPVTMPVLLALFSIAWLLVRAQLYIVAYMVPDDYGSGLPTRAGIMFLLVVVVFAGQAYLGMKFVQDLDMLPSQLSQFSITDSQCSCCFFNHRDPRTGKKIMCDRDYVYEAVSRQYSNPEIAMTPVSSGLDVFDWAVRSQLSDGITAATLSVNLIPVQLFIYMVWIWDIPFLADRIYDLYNYMIKDDDFILYRLLRILTFMVDWVKGLPTLLVLLFVATRTWRYFAQVKRCPRVCLALICAPVVVLGPFLVFVIISVGHDVTNGDIPLNIPPFALFLTLAICLLLPRKQPAPMATVAAPAQVLQHYPSYAFSEQSSQNVAPVDGEATDITGITLPEAAEITLQDDFFSV